MRQSISTFNCIMFDANASMRQYSNTVEHVCVRVGLKGKTMEGEGGPKRSYAGGKIRETKGKLYYTKLNATITVCETKGVQKTPKQSSKESSKTK